MSLIYKITNTINSKQYVGQTTKTLMERFDAHESKSKYVDTYLYRAIRKYGLPAFTIEVLEEVEPELLSERERFWIAKLNTLIPNGYNMTEGGEGGDTSMSHNYQKAMKNRRSYAGIGNPNYGKCGTDSPNFGKKRTERQKDNLKQRLTEAWAANDGRRQKFSDRMSGDNNPRFGKMPPNAIAVVFNGEVYDSLAKASRLTGRSPQYIKKYGTIIKNE